MTSTVLPLVSYLQGATRPIITLDLPGGGDLTLYTERKLIVSECVPGDTELLRIDTAAIVAGTDSVDVDVAGSGIEALDPGTYGLTFTAVDPTTGLAKWIGQLEITAAN